MFENYPSFSSAVCVDSVLCSAAVSSTFVEAIIAKKERLQFFSLSQRSLLYVSVTSNDWQLSRPPEN